MPFTVVNHRGGSAVIYQSDRVFQSLNRALLDDDFFIGIGCDEVDDIRAINALVQGAASQLISVPQILSELGHLKMLPNDSPLRFLGYFSLLESLLTHPPKPTDPYDSITRQIVKKLALLNHRLPRQINYIPFNGATAEKVWQAMYSCRGAVAHGGLPEFTGKHQLLQSRGAALKLIKETTKAVIVQAMREPQLIVDLREC